jgi:hypothetical protein
LVILKGARFEPAGKLDLPILSSQHFKHRLDIRARTRQQIIVEDVPASRIGSRRGVGSCFHTEQNQQRRGQPRDVNP